jgi:hypothetical protein
MTSNPEPIVQQVQHEFQNLVAYVTGPDARAQTAEPAAPPSTATILVVQAAGKGVPMVQPSTQQPAMRLSKGQKRTNKKEAVVTGLYTLSPYPRTPQEVVAALLDDEHPTSVARPVPVGKDQRATLAGKADAMRRLAQRVSAGIDVMTHIVADKPSMVSVSAEHPCTYPSD